MPTGKGISLLFIEDNKDVLDLSVQIIQMRFPKLIIHPATSPEEALDLFKEYKHDIVITDIFAPKQQVGLKIASLICDAKPEAIVIFITAETNIKLDHLKKKAKILCLEGLIHKPVDLKELLKIIKDAIAIASDRKKAN